MKNILSLMVTQKKSKKNSVKINIEDPAEPQLELNFVPYINFGFINDELHQTKRTRELIMCPDDKKTNEIYLFDDRDYISRKLIHEKREYLTVEQNRRLINYTLKLLIPQSSVDKFKKLGLTIKEISDQFMVHTEIVYMRLNLPESVK